MLKIELIKNGKTVFEKFGIRENEKLKFENISYDPSLYILTREDDNFKYTLDFSNEEAIVLLKEKNFELKLNLKVINLDVFDSVHEIVYNIESDDEIQNKIVVNIVE